MLFQAIIDGVPEGKLIDPLVKIMLNCNLNDVRKEAAWAISNAMCGVGIDQIEYVFFMNYFNVL